MRIGHGPQSSLTFHSYRRKEMGVCGIRGGDDHHVSRVDGVIEVRLRLSRRRRDNVPYGDETIGTADCNVTWGQPRHACAETRGWSCLKDR